MILNRNLFSRLIHSQEMLIAKMEEQMLKFDEDLAQIIDDKRNLSIELKYIEVTMICMYEELQASC